MQQKHADDASGKILDQENMNVATGKETPEQRLQFIKAATEYRRSFFAPDAGTSTTIPAMVWNLLAAAGGLAVGIVLLKYGLSYSPPRRRRMGEASKGGITTGEVALTAAGVGGLGLGAYLALKPSSSSAQGGGGAPGGGGQPKPKPLPKPLPPTPQPSAPIDLNGMNTGAISVQANPGTIVHVVPPTNTNATIRWQVTSSNPLLLSVTPGVDVSGIAYGAIVQNGTAVVTAVLVDDITGRQVAEAFTWNVSTYGDDKAGGA